MIRILSFVGYSRNTCHDWICRISLVWSPYIFCTSHGYTMIISSSTFRTHNIIISISLGQMWCFDTAAVGSSVPDTFRITDHFLFLRWIFYHTNRTRFFIAFTGFPLQGYNPFSAIIVMKHGGIKSCWMQIYRLAPWSSNILCCNHKVVHIKISRVHGIHHSIHYIK